jgi:isochorismate hydrolase
VLRMNNAKQVIITGVATNICCETTAHDAFFRGYEVFFAADGTGGTDESAHLASLKNIVLSYGKAASVDQLCRGLETRKTP